MATIFRGPLFAPRPLEPGRQDWIWSTPDTLLNPPGLTPGVMHDWPNPMPRAPGRQDWLWPSALALLTAPVAAPFAQSVWPNPGIPPRLIELHTWLWPTADVLLNPPGSNPAAQYDWPNPRGYPYPIELRTFTQGLLPTFAPPNLKPFDLADWPNPRGAPFQIQLRGQPEATNINLGVPPAPPPLPTVELSTPGRIKDIYDHYRQQERDQRDRARRGRTERDQVTTDHPVTTVEQTDHYSRESARLAAAIEKLRGEEAGFRTESDRLRAEIAAAKEANRRASTVAKLDRELRDSEQAIVLSGIQQAALLEELEVIDIAYVAMIALTMVMQ